MKNHERFPKRVNTEFVNVLDRHTAQMRVWERGSGETLACGTGACAVAVACALNGLTEDEVTVKLLGGDLQIKSAADMGALIFDGLCDGIFLFNQGSLSHAVVDATASVSCRQDTRTSKTEYISCPGCGRTLYDLEKNNWAYQGGYLTSERLENRHHGMYRQRSR